MATEAEERAEYERLMARHAAATGDGAVAPLPPGDTDPRAQRAEYEQLQARATGLPAGSTPFGLGSPEDDRYTYVNPHENLPDVMYSLPFRSLEGAAAAFTSSGAEDVEAIVKKSHPGVKVETTPEGYKIYEFQGDPQKYAWKPGAHGSDLFRMAPMMALSTALGVGLPVLLQKVGLGRLVKPAVAAAAGAAGTGASLTVPAMMAEGALVAKGGEMLKEKVGAPQNPLNVVVGGLAPTIAPGLQKLGAAGAQFANWATGPATQTIDEIAPLVPNAVRGVFGGLGAETDVAALAAKQAAVTGPAAEQAAEQAAAAAAAREATERAAAERLAAETLAAQTAAENAKRLARLTAQAEVRAASEGGEGAAVAAQTAAEEAKRLARLTAQAEVRAASEGGEGAAVAAQTAAEEAKRAARLAAEGAKRTASMEGEKATAAVAAKTEEVLAGAVGPAKGVLADAQEAAKRWGATDHSSFDRKFMDRQTGAIADSQVRSNAIGAELKRVMPNTTPVPPEEVSAAVKWIDETMAGTSDKFQSDTLKAAKAALSDPGLQMGTLTKLRQEASTEGWKGMFASTSKGEGKTLAHFLMDAEVGVAEKFSGGPNTGGLINKTGATAADLAKAMRTEVAGRIGLQDALREASIVKGTKALKGALRGSAVPAMDSAGAAIQKGNVAPLVALLDATPKDMRPALMANIIKRAAMEGEGAEGAQKLADFVNTIRGEKGVAARVFGVLRPDMKNELLDLARRAEAAAAQKVDTEAAARGAKAEATSLVKRQVKDDVAAAGGAKADAVLAANRTKAEAIRSANRETASAVELAENAKADAVLAANRAKAEAIRSANRETASAVELAGNAKADAVLAANRARAATVAKVGQQNAASIEKAKVAEAAAKQARDHADSLNINMAKELEPVAAALGKGNLEPFRASVKAAKSAGMEHEATASIVQHAMFPAGEEGLEKAAAFSAKLKASPTTQAELFAHLPPDAPVAVKAAMKIVDLAHSGTAEGGKRNEGFLGRLAQMTRSIGARGLGTLGGLGGAAVGTATGIGPMAGGAIGGGASYSIGSMLLSGLGKEASEGAKVANRFLATSEGRALLKYFGLHREVPQSVLQRAGQNSVFKKLVQLAGRPPEKAVSVLQQLVTGGVKAAATSNNTKEGR